MITNIWVMRFALYILVGRGFGDALYYQYGKGDTPGLAMVTLPDDHPPKLAFRKALSASKERRAATRAGDRCTKAISLAGLRTNFRLYNTTQGMECSLKQNLTCDKLIPHF